jgi:hypothetical protein
MFNVPISSTDRHAGRVEWISGKHESPLDLDAVAAPQQPEGTNN